jgi:hypothetical protein
VERRDAHNLLAPSATLEDARFEVSSFNRPRRSLLSLCIPGSKGAADSGGLAGQTTAGALAQSVSFATGAIPVGPKSYTQCAKVRDLGRCGTSGRYNPFVTMREIIPLNRKAK